MNAVATVDDRVRNALPVYLMNTGFDHRQEPRNRPSGAGFYQFLYITKGQGVLESGESTLLLSEGMTVFTSADVPHAYHATDGEMRTGWVAFQGAQTATVLDYFGAPDMAFLHSDAVRLQMSDIYKKTAHFAPPELLSAMVYRLIVTFFDELNQAKKPPHLLAAKSYMEENAGRDLSVFEIASAVGISESLLYRLFRLEEGTTPVDYLREIRIRNAKALLIGDSELRVSEIALRVGFSDAAYFCKIFKAETGMTPRTYRMRNVF